MNLGWMTRRRWLGLAGFLPFVSGLFRGTSVGACPLEQATAIRTAEQGLEALKLGNRRFADQESIHAHQAANWRAHLTAGQQPFATILACSDSRVPPELVFDQGFGDLFVIRVAGNIIAQDVVGSIAYALVHLKTPLVVVMGHQGCGAVTAALETIDGEGEEPKVIANLLKHITPGIKDLDPKLTGDARVSAGVEANVRASMALLSKTPGAEAFLNNKDYRLAGAVYELGTGRVRFLA